MEVDKGKEEVEETRKVAEADGDTVTLKSSDGKLFEVSKEAAARLSTVLAGMIAGGSTDDNGTDLKQIGSEALENVVDYCNKHANSIPSAARISSSISFNTAPFKEPEEWERKFVDRLSHDALFDLVEAANFLGMDRLLDITCHKISEMMKGKSPDQIRDVFNIKNDYTKEELEEIRQELAWAFYYD
ncbi:hypothetical protein HU200_046007 [Digitaria exilis]|uniref:SKP1-like protein n=1 Tax=Digitaria exilis TaxID=1010633 RepID=A0A835ECZ9_9POAL|nr:hypothetical protein HU200_046007 [Digitaria exilis]